MEVMAYKVRIYQSYSIWDQGSSYAWDPWGEDTDLIKGDDEEIYVNIPDTHHLAKSEIDETRLYPGGHDLEEAIALGLAKIV